MCGVIGCFPRSKYLSSYHTEQFAKLLKESRVRGMHAYGVSRLEDMDEWQHLKTFDLYEAMDFAQRSIGCKALIGHTRYDTSGDYKELQNNQPVIVGKDFLVFNGVIRMSKKEDWENEFQFPAHSENDGEIMLWALKNGYRTDDFGFVHPMYVLSDPTVSYAGIQVVDGQISYARNERRPLVHYTDGMGTFWIASTSDIIARTFSKNEPIMFVENVQPGEFHYVKSNS